MSLSSAAVVPPDPRLATKGMPPVRFWLLFAVCDFACVLAVLKPILGLGMAGAVVGCCLVVYLLAALLSGRVEPMILTWVLIFPLGYYFLSFPREKSRRPSIAYGWDGTLRTICCFSFLFAG